MALYKKMIVILSIINSITIIFAFD